MCAMFYKNRLRGLGGVRKPTYRQTSVNYYIDTDLLVN